MLTSRSPSRVTPSLVRNLYVRFVDFLKVAEYRVEPFILGKLLSLCESESSRFRDLLAR